MLKLLFDQTHITIFKEVIIYKYNNQIVKRKQLTHVYSIFILCQRRKTIAC